MNNLKKLNRHQLTKNKKQKWIKVNKKYISRNNKLTKMSNHIILVHSFQNLYSQKEYNFIKMINKLNKKLHLLNNHKIKYFKKKTQAKKQMKNTIILKKWIKKWIFKILKFLMMILMLSQK